MIGGVKVARLPGRIVGAESDRQFREYRLPKESRLCAP
jgi:hypothetical protein